MPADHRARREVAELAERLSGLGKLLDEREKQVNIAFTAASKATDAALEAQRAINIASNEWRGSLRDQQATLATRGEVDRLTERIGNLEKSNERTGGRATGVSAAQMVLLAVLAILVPAAIALAVAFWKGG